MDLLAFLASLLSRFFAMSLGCTVLPLRTLVFNFLGIIREFAPIMLLVLEIPNMFIQFCTEYGFPVLWGSLLVFFVVIPFTVAVSCSVILVAAICFLAVTLPQMIFVALAGLFSGLFKGMDGFWDAYGMQEDEFVYSGAYEVAGSGVENFNDLEDVVVPRAFPDEGSISEYDSNNLKKEESLAVDVLIKSCMEQKGLLTDKSLNQFETLKKKFDRYTQLSLRMESVQKALKNNTISDLDCDLIASCPLTNPILFVKLYNADSQHEWHVVPQSSYVADKDLLEKWVTQNSAHPITRDRINNPDLFNKCNTMYRWYKLTAESCSSQELAEGAIEIRSLAKDLTAVITQLKEAEVGLGVSSELFRPVVLSSNTATYSSTIVPGTVNFG